MSKRKNWQIFTELILLKCYTSGLQVWAGRLGFRLSDGDHAEGAGVVGALGYDVKLVVGWRRTHAMSSNVIKHAPHASHRVHLATCDAEHSERVLANFAAFA